MARTWAIVATAFLCIVPVAAEESTTVDLPLVVSYTIQNKPGQGTFVPSEVGQRVEIGTLRGLKRAIEAHEDRLKCEFEEPVPQEKGPPLYAMNCKNAAFQFTMCFTIEDMEARASFAYGWHKGEPFPFDSVQRGEDLAILLSELTRPQARSPN